MMPKYLRRGLGFQELKHKMRKGDEFIVWKFGRTSHYTFGVVSDIISDYQLPNGLISAQLLIMDYWDYYQYPKTTFSNRGDCVSLVWDFQGHVCGSLWGGQELDFATYVTPIEFVLEDIRKQCNVKEVKLVVRPEESAELPDPPPRLPKASHRDLPEQDTDADWSDYDIIELEEAFDTAWDAESSN
jgi:hypothetical protein